MPYDAFTKHLAERLHPWPIQNEVAWEIIQETLNAAYNRGYDMRRSQEEDDH
jgi:hypothetical protein